MVSEELKEFTEEVTIDLSRVPLRPTSKKEIQQLEMALIIATLYSPEVLELIRDPIERATWVDSLAVAAAALARQKAGYSIPQIADEVGRSETMIRAHLSGKTKAGKLVLQTYEKLKRGELKIVVPFIKLPAEMAVKLQDLERIRKELEEKLRKYEQEIRDLKSQIKKYEERIAELTEKIRNYEEEINKLRENYSKIEEEKKQLEEKVKEYEEKIRTLEEENNELKKTVEEKRKILLEVKEKLTILEELKQLIEKAI